MKRREPKTEATRPHILEYHDYRAFLKDWLEYRKSTGLSLRALAREAGLALGYLPMVLSGSRTLSPKALGKLARPLGLTAQEKLVLELLVQVADGDTQQARQDALDRLQRSGAYRRQNPKEAETYRYLSRWYYVAIREMAGIEGFRADPKWIQKRLRPRVSLTEVEEALSFLTANGFLTVDAKGKVRRPAKDVACVGDVYGVALAQFHRQMLGLTTDSLSLSAQERTVMGHTLALTAQDYEALQKILSDALDRSAGLEKPDKKQDRVYHVLVAAIPLTAHKEEKEP